MTADLQGSATITRPAALLVGQTAIVNLQMTPAALEETLTVRGQAQEAASPVALLEWAGQQRAAHAAQLHQAAAILFRGFQFESVEVFGQFAAIYCAPLDNYAGGNSPRTRRVHVHRVFPRRGDRLGQSW